LTDADKKKTTFVFHEMKDMYLSFGIYQISYELTFQSIVLKNECLLISSTPSGPAPEIQSQVFNKPTEKMHQIFSA